MFSCTTAQHIYCTKCTVCNRTVLTVITQKLQLHVQLHNSTAHLLYKYCTKCTVCNRTVLTVITQKLQVHVQLHNSTAHLLYKMYSLQQNCTYSNYTEAAVTCSAAQQHRTVQLMSSDVQCSRMFNTKSTYTHIHVHKVNPSKNSEDSKSTATISQHYTTWAAVRVRRLQSVSSQLIWQDARMIFGDETGYGWWVGQEVPAASALRCHLLAVSTVTEPFQLQ